MGVESLLLPVGSTQFIRVGGRYLYMLRHQASPRLVYTSGWSQRR